MAARLRGVLMSFVWVCGCYPSEPMTCESHPFFFQVKESRKTRILPLVRTMTGRGRRSAQSRKYEQNRKLKKFVNGLKPSVKAKLLELDSHTLEEILGVATKQESRAGPLQEGEATPKEDVTKPFQRQDKKKEKLLESQQSTMTSISEKLECIKCGKRHVGNACWRKEGRALTLLLGLHTRLLNALNWQLPLLSQPPGTTKPPPNPQIWLRTNLLLCLSGRTWLSLRCSNLHLGLQKASFLRCSIQICRNSVGNTSQ
ncbi:hypothetical protein Taro_013431 [Colocasia esculenta]|uniref:Uncharacterized protein n=1 Tax=Colocasia esculenta TaxID=4460 RepID=A0A843UFY3_COLES|nr:hypothetical protein [Colocasia esculenta]